MAKRQEKQLVIPTDPNYFGKAMPQAVDLEEYVLGGLLVSGRYDSSFIFDILTTEDAFYHEPHKIIYRAMSLVFKSGYPIDIPCVANQLRQMGLLDKAGGAFYLTELANRVASCADLEHHSRIMLQKWIARQTIEFSNKAINDAFDTTQDCFELVERLTAFGEEMSVKLNINTGQEKTIEDAIKARLEDKTPLQYFPMFIENLAEIWAGIFPQDYVLFTARPKSGKTSFALQLLYALGERGTNVAYINLDNMSTNQLIDRILQQQTSANSYNLRLNRLSESDTQEATDFSYHVKEMPIYFVEQTEHSLSAVKAQIESLINRDVKFFIIDYLQLIKGTAKTEKDSLEEVSATLKSLIKKHKITIFALGQLNQSGTNLSGSDNPLRDCTTHVNCAPAIENEEAFRDSIPGNMGEMPKDFILFQVKRQRYGTSGDAYVRFNSNKLLFTDSNYSNF